MIKKSTLILFGFMFIFTDIKSSRKSQVNDEIQIIQKSSTNNSGELVELSKDIYRVSKNKNYKKVIQISEKIENLAIEEKNDTALASSYRLKAAAYIELNLNKEGLETLNKAINVAEKISSDNDRYYSKALISREFATYYSQINASVDLVMCYHNQSLENALKIQDHKSFVEKKYALLAITYLNLGMMNVASGRIENALVYLKQALSICQNQKSLKGDLEVSVLNELAWIYYEQEQYIKAAQFAEEAEKKEKLIDLPYIRRDIYEVSFKAYSALKKVESSKKYTNLYIKLNDSLVSSESNNANLYSKKNKNNEEQANQSLISKTLLIIVIILAIIVLIFVFKNRDKKNITATESVDISEVDEVPEDEEDTDDSPTGNLVKKNITIPDHTSKSLLLKLNKFEKSQKFLKKDLSLTSLAKDLNTNTRYLSETIKQYKDKNYNNYINNLRIEYIKNKLIENPIYREYKISYLAEECGFSSREVFAATFKKETGVNPSYFINSLDKDFVHNKPLK